MRIPELTKRPNEAFAIGLKYVSPDLGEGASVVSATCAITPDVTDGLKRSGNVVIEPDTVSQMVYGGKDGQEYYAKFTVVTSGGHTYEDAIFVKVRDF